MNGFFGLLKMKINKDYLELCEKIKYSFKDINLLETALTHKSFYRNNGKVLIHAAQAQNHKYNERMEILGDAVIELAVTDYLYKMPENLSEGRITRIRAFSVNRKALSNAARNLGLHNILRLGAAEKKSNRNMSHRLQADVFEALIGAVYLDSGLEIAADMVIKMLKIYITESIESKTGFPDDHKSMLQELLHKITGHTPVYEVVESIGPDHLKSFKVEAKTSINNILLTAIGSGNSIQSAEQNSAEKMVEQIKKMEEEKCLSTKKIL